MKILVVEDNLMIRGLIVRYVREDFFAEITEVSNGVEALAISKNQKFDLILSDIEMPEMTGIELCQHLKQQKANRETPVIIVSALTNAKQIEEGFRVGAAAYISKPFSQAQLREHIRQFVTVNEPTEQQTILIVEDTSSIRGFLSKKLTECGYNVLTAENGAKAWQILKAQQVNLILSDFHMPEMDGDELLAKCKKDTSTASLPFIIMSTDSDVSSMRKMLKNGATTYILKPFQPDHLTVLLEKYLSDHYMQVFRDREKLKLEQKAMLSTIMSLVQALEARDAYTRSHSESVAEISVHIGRELCLSDEDLKTLLIGGRLHDIGKIGIRDDVLLKPGKLTDEEYESIKMHPTIGNDILSHIPSLQSILPVVRHHHERYDGQGYPDGLKGDDINILARVLAVSDVFHALASDRPYRKAMPMEKALSIINELRGNQLCPLCVDAFLAIHKKNGIEWHDITTMHIS